MLVREGKYSLEEIRDKIAITNNKYDLQKSRIILDGHQVRNSSIRLQTFKAKGVICCDCGRVGSFFALERSAGSIIPTCHLNLYAIDTDGNEVLMTKDHIIPKSRGGKDILENLQTMCMPCNNKKGNKIIE